MTNGVISGVTQILNIGTLTSLTNNGTLSGGHVGISNPGTIGAVNNTANGVISSDFTGLYSFGMLNMLSNSGTISGSNSGVFNASALNTLNNTGLISGGHGINNAGGTIGALSNSGTISGVTSGVMNSGTIGLLDNNGVFTSNAGSAIENMATIGTLTNNGSISGVIGIMNGGTISTLTNAATITDVSLGINNTGSGTVYALLNNGTISSGATGISNGGAIGTLTNDGSINGTIFGINNAGTVNMLTNSVRISRGTTGVGNSGAIGTLTNGGTIIGASFGLNSTGPINVLLNSGTISGGSKAGIGNNAGLIGSLTNSGVIAGGADGINNRGIITSLINDATISGTITGIASGGSATVAHVGSGIGTLTNSGLISGSTTGINNDGSIAVLSNSGTIAGAVYGIKSEPTANGNYGGTVGILTNSGTISGGTAAILGNGGGFEQIANTGLISGNIQILNQNVTITGGSGSEFGVLSGGTISLTPGDALEFAAGNQVLADDVDVGTTGSLTNDGTLQIGTPQTTPSLTLNGNFMQNADGTLVVPIAPAQSSVLNVSGNAGIAGNVVYDFAPGTYTSRTYEYITAASVTGNFAGTATENLPANAATQTRYLTDPGVELTLTASPPPPTPPPPAPPPVTPPTTPPPVTPPTTPPTTTPTPTATPPSATPMPQPVIIVSQPAPVVTPRPIVVAPQDAAVFGAESQAMAVVAQQNTGLLLEKAVSGGTADPNVCGVPPDAGSGAGYTQNLTARLAAGFCEAGGWMEATGALMHTGDSGGAPGYHADTGGFLAGIDRQFDRTGTRIGIALGYGKTYLNDNAAGKASVGTTSVALYMAQPLARVVLSAVISYGHSGNSTTRPTGIAPLSADNNANIYSGGVQASLPAPFGKFGLIPAIGLRFADVDAGHFGETAGAQLGAFAVQGKIPHYTSVQPFVSLQGTHRFVTASQVVIAPDATIGVEYEAADRGTAASVQAADGTNFSTPHGNLDRGAALLGAGVSAGRSHWSLYANYSAHLSGNWTEQTGEFGLQVNF